MQQKHNGDRQVNPCPTNFDAREHTHICVHTLVVSPSNQTRAEILESMLEVLSVELEEVFDVERQACAQPPV